MKDDCYTCRLLVRESCWLLPIHSSVLDNSDTRAATAVSSSERSPGTFGTRRSTPRLQPSISTRLVGKGALRGFPEVDREVPLLVPQLHETASPGARLAVTHRDVAAARISLGSQRHQRVHPCGRASGDV